MKFRKFAFATETTAPETTAELIVSEAISQIAASEAEVPVTKIPTGMTSKKAAAAKARAEKAAKATTPEATTPATTEPVSEFASDTRSAILSIALIAPKAAKKAATPKAPGEISLRQSVIFDLMARENGASISEMVAAGHRGSAISALRSAEKNGYTTSITKAEGSTNRYCAKRPA